MTDPSPTPAEVLNDLRRVAAVYTGDFHRGSDGERLTRAADALEGEMRKVAALARWKEEAIPVISGLQELGRALGLRLGTSITGKEAAQSAKALRAERDALAAIRAEVLAWAVEHGAPGAYPSEPFTFDKGVSAAATDVHGILSKLPADALAAHDARVLSDLADEMDADPEFRDPLRLKSDWVRARIEREAQR